MISKQEAIANETWGELNFQHLRAPEMKMAAALNRERMGFGTSQIYRAFLQLCSSKDGLCVNKAGFCRPRWPQSARSFDEGKNRNWALVGIVQRNTAAWKM